MAQLRLQQRMLHQRTHPLHDDHLHARSCLHKTIASDNTFMQDPACTRLLHQTINTSTLISFVRHSHPIIACIPNSSLSCSTCFIYSPTCIHHIQISLCEFLHCHLALLVTYCYSHISCAGSLRISITFVHHSII